MLDQRLYAAQALREDEDLGGLHEADSSIKIALQDKADHAAEPWVDHLRHIVAQHQQEAKLTLMIV